MHPLFVNLYFFSVHFYLLCRFCLIWNMYIHLDMKDMYIFSLYENALYLRYRVLSVAEAISWISVVEAISWIYTVRELVSPNSLPAWEERISIPYSGVRLHSVALHLLSKQHPHLTATPWVHSQILGKKSHITASYCPTSYLVHTVYGDLNLHKGCWCYTNIGDAPEVTTFTSG